MRSTKEHDQGACLSGLDAQEQPVVRETLSVCFRKIEAARVSYRSSRALVSMNPSVSGHTLQAMTAYYQARADEYDECYYRQGHYDRGLEKNAHWFAELSVRR